MVMEKENTDSSRIEIVALIRKIAILLYRKPAKPLVTNAAMRNKAGLLFVYWKVLDAHIQFTFVVQSVCRPVRESSRTELVNSVSKIAFANRKLQVCHQ